MPLLLLILVGAADFARVFFYGQLLTNCAWNGAAFAANPDLSETLSYESVQQAALAGSESLVPTPAVQVTDGTDGTGQRYVQVTVSWAFRRLASLPGIPNTIALQRTSRMRLRPEPEED